MCGRAHPVAQQDARIARPCLGPEPAQERAAFLAAIVQSSASAIIGKTLDGTVTSWNPGAERLYGYTATEIIGHNISRLVAPGGPNDVPMILDHIRRGEQVGPIETVRRCKDGSLLEVLLSVSPVRDQAGRIIGAATVAHDISERKRTERELIASRKQALEILESIGDAFYALDNDWRFTYVNARAEQLWQKQREDLVGRRIWDVFPKAEGSETHAEHERAMATRQALEYETFSPVIKRWIEVNVYPSATGLSVYFRDITARKEAQAAERKLTRHTERLARQTAALAQTSRILAEASLDLPFALQALASSVAKHIGDGCVIYLLSGDTDELEVAGLHHPDAEALMLARQVLGDSAAIRQMHHLLASGQPSLEGTFGAEARRTSSKPEVWPLFDRFGAFQRLAVPLCLRNQPIGVVAVWRRGSGRPYTDEDVELLEQLADRGALAIQSGRLFAQAQEAIRLREEVLAAVSHDLRTPLTSIRGTAQLVERTAERDEQLSSERVRAQMRRIQNATTRMERWIAELIDVARLQAGQELTLNRTPTLLSSLVTEAVTEFQQATPDRPILLDVASDEATGFWDATRLRRVIDNLLSNATKYSPQEKCIEVAVRQVERSGAHWATLRVSDYGVGIPSADLPHLFEHYRRGGNVGRISGSGIGLAGAHRIVQQHGGRLEVESREGAGSTFTVWLPIDRGAAGLAHT